MDKAISKTASKESSEFRNIWAAQKSEASEVAAFEKAWHRYMKSLGYTDEQIVANRRGLSDEQIRQIEEGICMRLRDDVKAYLKVYLSDGTRFLNSHSLEKHESSSIIVQRWREKCKYSYDRYGFLRYDLPPKTDEPWADRHESRFEAFMLPVNDDPLFNIYIDVRNGRMIEEGRGNYYVIANSIAELFDEIAEHQEAGKIVSNFYRREDGSATPYKPMLKSSPMIKVYER